MMPSIQLGAIPWKTVANVAIVVVFVGLCLYLVNTGKRLERYKNLTEQQKREIEACNASVRTLEYEIDEQTESLEESQRAAMEANALVEELLSRPVPTPPPREVIVERVRPGDCDRAAVDAWRVFNETMEGVRAWEEQPDVRPRSALEWRDYYLSQPGALPPSGASGSFPAGRGFTAYVWESPFPQPGPSSIHSPTLIYGSMTSP